MNKPGEDVVIKVSSVSKSFKLPLEKHNTMKNQLFSFFRKGERGYVEQHVLSDISFEVKKGDFFGVVGRNGSGKSTLLKLLAGIYEPDNGSISINGKLTPFIELGVGFNFDLTGRENVFLNGALLGFSRQEMLAMYDEIVQFAELHDFMDQKLKNYSSGMQVRLAFSIAIRARTDILVLDEVLAVGDAAFQQKCYDTFTELKNQGVTIILVTHDMNSVLRFCNKAIMLHEGHIYEQGAPSKVADIYLRLNFSGQERTLPQLDDASNTDKKSLISLVEFVDGGGLSAQFDPGDKAKIAIEYINPKKEHLRFSLQVYNESDVYCFGTNTLIDNTSIKNSAKGRVTVKIRLNLTPGNYYVTVGVLDKNAIKTISYNPKAVKFRITKKTQQEGIALLDHQWGYDDV